MSKDKVLFKCPNCGEEYIQQMLDDSEQWDLYKDDAQVEIDCIECPAQYQVIVSATGFSYEVEDY